ncbi:DUF4258 domain-containing protein [Edaphovirga cremea]|uniref:DUF4258 domain-containing protein n=1 Tax=Edaphovirga cremea TaxID=2267246 RepID=UPI00398A0058
MKLEENHQLYSLPINDVLAKQIIHELASNDTKRILFSSHAKLRMQQRNISIRQVSNILTSRHSQFTESPHLTPSGDWKCNLQGIAAGDCIEVVLVLKRYEYDPSIFVVTVMIK